MQQMQGSNHVIDQSSSRDFHKLTENGDHQAVEMKMPLPRDSIAFTEALADVTRL